MQRQLLIKVLMVSLLAVLLLIPIHHIRGVINERVVFKHQATEDVATSWTGEQTLLPPVLVIQYDVPQAVNQGFDAGLSKTRRVSKQHIVFASQLAITAAVDNTTLNRGLYAIPVYTAEIGIKGLFTQQDIAQAINAIQQRHPEAVFQTSYLTSHLEDSRGLVGKPTVFINNTEQPVLPSTVTTLPGGGFTTEIDVVNLKQDLALHTTLGAKGMARLAVLPFAKNLTLEIRSDWPHPKFDGAALPIKRHIDAEGFSATWHSSWFSNTALAETQRCMASASCKQLAKHAFGVQFIDTVDVYTMAERSLKYAILFIAISFMGFFIVENIQAIRIHPVQYGFIGITLAVFFLVLVALSEHIAFYKAYATSVVCSVALLSIYSRYVFSNIKAAVVYGLCNCTLFALLFGIIQSEDYALLMGSLLVFGTLAITLWVTRKIDWYAVKTPLVSEEQTP